MSSALDLNPHDVNYLSSFLIHNQLTENQREVALNEDNVTASVTPTVALDGAGRAYLLGNVTISNGSPTANMELLNLPTNLIPLQDYYFPVTVLRAGANVANSIKVASGGSTIQDVIITAVGSTTTLPTVTTTGPGSGASLSAVMKGLTPTVATAQASGSYAPADTITLTGGTFSSATVLTVTNTKLVSAAVNAAGSGYVVGNTITLSGGTAVTPAILTVATTKLVSVVENAAGSGYAPTNTITLAGGTHATAAVLTVATTKLVSVAINAGGSGYEIGDTVTLNGGTHTIAAIITVNTVDGGGAILTFSITTAGSYTVNSATFTQASTSGSGVSATFQTGLFGVNTFTISNAGSYTVNSATFTQSATSGSGTGFTANSGLFGVNTFTISTAGVYTTNSTTFTQAATTGSGTGFTANTGLFGVNTAAVTTPGSYTVLPSNPVSQGSSSGSGVGATFTMTWGVLSVTVVDGGEGFTEASGVLFSTGGAQGELDLAASTGSAVSLVTQPQQNDVVYLGTAQFLVNSYY